MAVYILGQCGYRPHEVKYRVPIYEINQVLHAHMVAQGEQLAWAVYDTEGESDLTRAFDRLKDDWEHRKTGI